LQASLIFCVKFGSFWILKLGFWKFDAFVMSCVD
jgi:hypothetical protein